MSRFFAKLGFTVLIFGVSALAQHSHDSGMNMNMNMSPETLTEQIEHHSGSGTSIEPNSTPVPMLSTTKGNWAFMFHGSAFVNALQQSSARGYDKFFSTYWFMP